MKATMLRIVLTVLTAPVLIACLSSCTVAKAKVAVIPLIGTIAGTSQQRLLITGGISPALVRDYLKKAETDGTMEQ